jgi:cyclopropane-fatty-acyl-phospholipid synthase
MSRSDSLKQRPAPLSRTGDAPSTRSGFIRSLSKRAITHRLSRLNSGSIELQDEAGRAVFGCDDASAQARILVHSPEFYRKTVLGGGLGFAESYIDGDWDSPDLSELLRVFVRDISIAHENDRGLARLRVPLLRFGSFVHRNTLRGSRRNIAAHYDLGNEFFALFLDDTMTYSSGIFYTPDDTLRDASLNKLDRICRKLRLAPGQHVLETGTGWGSFAIHAARNYGCRVTTTTISKRQHEIAKQRIEEAGLADQVTLLLEDYRDLRGSYDKVVSIEMIEAVGHDFLGTYLGACSRLLQPDGQMLLQVISMPDQRYKSYLRTSDFIRKHVFPGSCCPSLSAIQNAVAKSTDMRCVQYEDITPHYAATLEQWRLRFEESIDRVRELGYPEEFVRMWRYYLSYCIAGFAERYIGVGQMMLNKPGCREPVELPRLRAVPGSTTDKVQAC